MFEIEKYYEILKNLKFKFQNFYILQSNGKKELAIKK
jgi:hypothetical protein